MKFPKIEASYRFDFNRFSAQIGAGYQSYKIIASNVSYDIESYIAALGADMDLGRFYVKGNIFSGQNLAAYGIATGVNSGPATSFMSFDGQVTDNESYGFTLVAGGKINEMLCVEAGYGYTKSDFDKAGCGEDTAASYYIQTPITLFDGVFFVPEIGVIDHQKGVSRINVTKMVDEPKIYYFGAKWQINF